MWTILIKSVRMTFSTHFFSVLFLSGRDPLRVIEKDLKFLSHEIFHNLENIKKQQVRRLLKDLGVKSMTPSDLIYNHIIPILQEDRWKVRRMCILLLFNHFLFILNSRET